MMLALLGVILVQNAQAFYNPSTGRWLSRDPIAEKGTLLTESNRKSHSSRQNETSLYHYVFNDSLGKVDGFGLNPNIAPGTVISVDLQGGGSSTITVEGHMSQDEIITARKALCMARKLLGSPTYLPPFTDVYWAEIRSAGQTSVDGLTYDGSIFLDKYQKPSCDPSATARFGILLAHEADHFYTNSNDGPGGPEDRINAPALAALLKAKNEPWCGCCKGVWQLENLLGKYACECGLAPCKPKPCKPLDPK